MHRMDEYSLERIRQKYLLPYIEHLSERVKTLKARESLNIAETKQLNKLQKLLEECREYHDRLHQYSQQNISFDLDDGVIKNYALMGDVVAKLK
jgi:restriction enzyme family protein